MTLQHTLRRALYVALATSLITAFAACDKDDATPKKKESETPAQVESKKGDKPDGSTGGSGASTSGEVIPVKPGEGNPGGGETTPGTTPPGEQDGPLMIGKPYQVYAARIVGDGFESQPQSLTDKSAITDQVKRYLVHVGIDKDIVNLAVRFIPKNILSSLTSSFEGKSLTLEHKFKSVTINGGIIGHYKHEDGKNLYTITPYAAKYFDFLQEQGIAVEQLQARMVKKDLVINFPLEHLRELFTKKLVEVNDFLPILVKKQLGKDPSKEEVKTVVKGWVNAILAGSVDIHFKFKEQLTK